MTRCTPLWVGLDFFAVGLVILVIGAAAGMAGPGGSGAADLGGPGSMMGGGPIASSQSGPGSPGFVPGMAAAPRVVEIVATPRLRVVPDAVTVKQGETITFEVTSMGPLTHEFSPPGRAAPAAASSASESSASERRWTVSQSSNVSGREGSTST